MWAMRVVRAWAICFVVGEMGRGVQMDLWVGMLTAVARGMKVSRAEMVESGGICMLMIFRQEYGLEGERVVRHASGGLRSM